MTWIEKDMRHTKSGFKPKDLIDWKDMDKPIPAIAMIRKILEKSLKISMM